MLYPLSSHVGLLSCLKHINCIHLQPVCFPQGRRLNRRHFHHPTGTGHHGFLCSCRINLHVSPPYLNLPCQRFPGFDCLTPSSSVHFMPLCFLPIRLRPFCVFFFSHSFVFCKLFQDRLFDWLLNLVLVFWCGLYFFRMGDGFLGLRISFADRGYCPLNSPKSCHLLQLWLVLEFYAIALVAKRL